MSTRTLFRDSIILRHASDRTINFDSTQKARLYDQGLTKGMIHQLELATADTAQHVWILDNSTSTNQLDSYRMIPNSNAYSQTHFEKCTRWEDSKDTALNHARIATYTHRPTTFRLLNTCHGIPSEYTIPSVSQQHQQSFYLMSHDNNYHKQHQHELVQFEEWLHSAWPTDRTPLIQHIQDFRTSIQSMEQTLRTKSQNVVLTIATDGLPCGLNGVCNDEQCELFRKAFKSLDKLPIQIIFRLTTNHSGVKKYYTELKNEVRFRIVVMNSFLSEAQSISQVNDWLTYSQSIHQMRECGAVSSCLDSLAERELSLFEMRDYCLFLFGYDSMTGVMDPTSGGWSRFIISMKSVLKGYKEQWDPSSNKVQPLLDIKQLSHIYGPSKSCKRFVRLFRLGF